MRTYSTDTITLLHDFKSIADFGKSLTMGDKFVNLDHAVQIILDESRQFRPSFDTTKGRSSPNTAGNELERSRLDLLTCCSNTDDDTLTPSLMTSLQCSSHDTNITSAVESIIAPAVSHVDEMFLNRFLEFGRVDEIGCAEFLGPGFFAIIGVDSDDLGGAVGNAALDDAESDTAGTKDGAGRALLNLGCSGCCAKTGGDTTAKETSFVEWCLGVDRYDRDIGDDCKSEKKL
jgi:hypothetical protein